jgi:hypothetical protein
MNLQSTEGSRPHPANFSNGRVRALVFPDHYVGSIGRAFVTEGIDTIMSRRMVPSYLHQYADLWARLNLRALGGRRTYWEAIAQREPATVPYLVAERIIAPRDEAGWS